MLPFRIGETGGQAAPARALQALQLRVARLLTNPACASPLRRGARPRRRERKGCDPPPVPARAPSSPALNCPPLRPSASSAPSGPPPPASPRDTHPHRLSSATVEQSTHTDLAELFMERDSGSTPPSTSTLSSAAALLLTTAMSTAPPSQPHSQAGRQQNSVPQLIQDLLTHDVVPSQQKPAQVQQRLEDSSVTQQQQPQQQQQQQQTSAASQAQRHACEPCRVAKAKCEPLSGAAEPNLPPASGPCKRCMKTDRECVFAERSKTRRRKRRDSSTGIGGATDQRVEELERRIVNLVAANLAGGIGGLDGLAGAKNTGGNSNHKQEERTRPADRSRIEDMLNSPTERRSTNKVSETGQHISKRPKTISTYRDVEGSVPRDESPALPNRGQSSENGPNGGMTCPDYSYSHLKDQTEYVPSSQPESTPLSPVNQNPHYQPNNSPRDSPSRRSRGTSLDIIDLELISINLATQLYNHFKVEILPHTPYIILPPLFTAAACRKSKPTLFLAIVCTSISRAPLALNTQVSVEKTRQIIEEFHWVLAERTMFRGEKSLDILQALLVATSWYTPIPEKGFLSSSEKHKSFGFISQAISVAFDLGLCRNNNPGGILRSSNPTCRGNAYPDVADIEGKRSFLGCYWLSVNACMVTRRPHLLRWSPQMSEAVDDLANGGDNGSRGVVSTDRILAEMCRAARIMEEAGTSGVFEALQDIGSSGSVGAGMRAAKIKFAVTALQRQVDDWWNAAPEIAKGHYSLSLFHYSLSMYIHEICLHSEAVPPPPHNPAAHFRAPFTDAMLRGSIGYANSPSGLSPLLTTLFIPVLLKNAHALLDAYLSIDQSTVGSLPHVAFGRMCYACLILVKIGFVFAPAPSIDKDNVECSAVFDEEELKLGYYLDKILSSLEAIEIGSAATSAYCLSRLFKNIKSWWERQGKPNPEPVRGCGDEIFRGEIAGGGGGGSHTDMSTTTVPSSQNTYSSTLPSSTYHSVSAFTPVNSSTMHQGNNGKYLHSCPPADQLTPPESTPSGSAAGFASTSAATPVNNDEYTVPFWALSDGDWVTLMNASGNGLPLFEWT
ncbi:hypothetical protein DFH27DRAFT_287357 [Peziza echinospora]|nr:hypothetical protein DFH27DRAFT_287357 [Peziza echinospora]